MTGFARALPFGATPLDGERARFRLWAPAQPGVTLEVEGCAPRPMTPVGDGWFETVAEAAPGASYLFRLASGQRVPDPAARAQSGDVHGPSLVIDAKAYVWRHAGWRGRPWRETVLYELHVGSLGGFAGVEADLGRLADLGITAIELMPVADFPGARNWGYDGVLPFAPDRAYGTPDELKRLIDSAHGLGLMVFLDVVYNHFGPDGNHLASYAPQFFRSDIATPWGPAIDFRQPQVRRFFVENALYWLMEYRFDGLRFDAVHAIHDQAWIDELGAEIRRTVEPGRHVHLVLEHDENDASHLRRGFDAQWNDDAHHVVHVLLTGETDGYYADYATDPAIRLARCLAEGFAYQGEPSRHRQGRPRGAPSTGLPPTAFVFFLQNHDQIGNRPFGDRLAALADPQALRAAMAMQLLCPHIPLLFMGEEFAVRTPFQFFTDFHGELATAVREGRRREFASFAGFAHDAIPDPNAPETFERSRPPRSGDDAFCRTLLQLRRQAIVPRLDGACAVSAVAIGRAAVLAQWRMGDGAMLSIATNLDGAACPFADPPGAPLFQTPDDAVRGGMLAARGTAVFLETR
ncbi:MAG: malto-oligosyltrehalose trehalohydrolase [Enhydrobacter sp.]|nr:MAG: malto-oligosyltrehalose trehalohydrolase [Enhydrobacter sp.]